MLLFWIGLFLLVSVPFSLTSWLTFQHYYLRIRYLHLMLRIFQERPLFVVPRGIPVADAEDVRFPTTSGLTLAGCYLKGRGPRHGVLLFGLEFGSNRWSCLPYCEHLLAAGYDVFAFESRNQGDSDALPGYDPLQWITDYEVQDTQAALAYLKGRPDADPRGIGFFGISKGGGAGLFAASRDPWVRCFVTDGAFATYTTLVPYMRQWFRIYNTRRHVQGLLPSWYFGQIGMVGLHQIERERHCHFPHLERVMPRLAPRPLLMIHGEADTYIKTEMAAALAALTRGSCEFWVVQGAKHNQALQIAGDDYRRRILEFFDKHLSDEPRTTLPPLARVIEEPPRSVAPSLHDEKQEGHPSSDTVTPIGPTFAR